MLNRQPHLRSRCISLLLLAIALAIAPVFTRAQQPATSPSADPQFTVHADARLVVEDVLVTDAHGTPVLHLPASAFHVTDNTKPQTLRNFEENATGTLTPAAAPAAPGVYSNSAMLGTAGPIAVLLLDPVGTEIADQMYLRLQVLHTLDHLPPDTQIAVFRTSAHGAPLLVQSLTQNRLLLRTAIGNCIPSFATPSSSAISVGLTQIAAITAYLGQIPGRKSLLWFASSFPLMQGPGGPEMEHESNDIQQLDAIKSTYRALQQARIAVFPIDMRGVVNVNLSLATHSDSTAPPVGTANEPIVGQSAALPGDDISQRSSWNAMDAIASATGGRAFYSNNNLDSVTRQALELGRHAYSLSYSPQPYLSNGTWHKVHITVDGGFTVSYRQGYYASAPPTPGSALQAAGQSSAQHTPSATNPATDPTPGQLPTPILFLARLEDAAPGPSKHASQFLIHYSIAAHDLSFAPGPDGSRQASLKVAALAYNSDGQVLSSAVDTVDTHYSAAQMALAARLGVPMFQPFTIAHGASYVLLSVVDLKTGRTGTVQLTVASARASATPHPN